MIRRPPRSTQGVSSAASDVYKRQVSTQSTWGTSGRVVDFGHEEQKQMVIPESALMIDPATQETSVWVIDPQTKTISKRQVTTGVEYKDCLLYTSPSPRDLSTSRMPSSA
eukprot:TRINITY_DN37328_c0_g1_i1.p2 TRINITY_DN37328_c0_g1~~TRINITY_DN37328_c0_g1_i1.p2  ORF type:complete len:110 (-),score=36.98 TRINITY_DN37328_c0_g1_i1:123-452(-)